MRSNSKLGRRRALVVVVLLTTCGTEVHNLKCRTSDHSRRQGEFVDIAEQCNNMTSDDRSSMQMGLDGDYSSSRFADQGDRRDNNNNNYNRRSNNNNREYNVHRQDFSNNNNNNNNNRGSGYYDDHDTTSCQVQPQQHSGNHGGRQKNYWQENSYYPSADYDVARRPSFDDRQSSPGRRYRRNSRRNAANGSNRLLGNNRFRNVTKTGGNQSRGSILDKMDACTIHCVFNQLQMLNSNSRPDKRSILNIMTNHIKDVELKEFIHDSIDECFDALELDSHTESKCDFSKNFSVCMENKAQKNCEDWDETGSATRTGFGQDGGGNGQLQDKRRGS